MFSDFFAIKFHNEALFTLVNISREFKKTTKNTDTFTFASLFSRYLNVYKQYIL